MGIILENVEICGLKRSFDEKWNGLDARKSEKRTGDF